MSLENVFGSGCTKLRPEDLLSDETVGVFDVCFANGVSIVDENDPLYQQHLEFRKEIESRPILLSLGEIKLRSEMGE